MTQKPIEMAKIIKRYSDKVIAIKQKSAPNQAATGSINQSVLNENAIVEMNLTETEAADSLRKVRKDFFPDDEAVCDCYDTLQRAPGAGYVRLRT